MRVLELAFIVFLFICIVSVAKSEQGKGRKINGKLKNLAGSPSRNSNGKVNFKDKMSIMLDIDGAETSMDVKRIDLRKPSKPPSKKDSEVAGYKKDDVFCIDIFEENKNEMRCKKSTEAGTLYFSDKWAMFLESSYGNFDSILEGKDIKVSEDGKVRVKAKEGKPLTPNFDEKKMKKVKPNIAERLSKKKSANPKSPSRKAEREAHKRETTSQKENIRERRSLVPDIDSDIAVINIMLVLDFGFTERIADLVGTDVNDIQAECETFLTLIVNEMAAQYQSLESHGETFTLNGQTHPLKMIPYLQQVVFPPLNTAGTAFVNFAWAEYHVDYKNAGQSSEKGFFAYHFYEFNYYYYDYVYTGSDYPLYSFGKWLQDSQYTGYDVAHFITGYDLGELDILLYWGGWYYGYEDTGVIGRAFLSSACRKHTGYYDLRSGVSELFAYSLSRLLSHEVAHNFGSSHDEWPWCTEGENIMSPYFEEPSTATPDVNKFSSCTASYIANYLSSITSYHFEECLYNNKPNATEFEEKFCQGTTGLNYDLSAQCKMYFGDASSVCAYGNSDTSDGFVPFDGCRIDSSNEQPLLLCSYGGSCTWPYDIYVIWPGTPCLNQNGTQGNRVCSIDGICSEFEDLCPSTTTSTISSTSSTSTTTTHP